jgi:3-isopropylmalate/(R)-2-methylmalate dehydratase small subunit
MSDRPFKRHTGIVAPLLRPNVDTDAIIPSREMKRVSRDGLGDGLFAGWRYRKGTKRDPDPGFVLNRERYRNATILAAGPNFGCGSSREHAVWALAEFGIRAILAPSFGAIFERNCVNNGLLPVTLAAEQIEKLLAATEADPQQRPLTIDLERGRITAPGAREAPFTVPEPQRSMLLEGLDPVDVTLQSADAIDAFERQDRSRRPWVYRWRGVP